MRKSRGRPRRYSVPVKIHVTDWTVVEEEPEPEKRRRTPTDYTPRFMSRDLIPSMNSLSEVDPFMKARPAASPDEEESPEKNWILPPATDFDQDEGSSDSIQSPGDYLELQLRSREEEYRDQMYPELDEERGAFGESDSMRQRQDRREGKLNGGEHLLFSDESYEDELRRDRADSESTSFRDGAGYEPVVMGTVSDSDGEEDGYAMARMSTESADARLFSDDTAGDPLYDEREATVFEALYGDKAMSRDGVSVLGGADVESEEEGFSMTSRLLMGLSGDEAPDESVDREMSEGRPRGSFPLLAHTLGRTIGSSATETGDARLAETAATTTPGASWLSTGSSFRSPPSRRESAFSFRSTSSPSGRPQGGEAIGRTPRSLFSSPNSLPGTIRSSASPGVIAPGPTTDFESSPWRAPQTRPGSDIKNLDILMH